MGKQNPRCAKTKRKATGLEPWIKIICLKINMMKYNETNGEKNEWKMVGIQKYIQMGLI